MKPRKAKNNKKALLLLALALVGVLAAGGVLYNLLLKNNAPAGAAYGDLPGPAAAPDFTAQDWEGNSVALSDFVGTPVVLNFWASWCGPCQAEMPYFEEMYQAYGDQVQFLMLDLVNDAEPIATGKAFIDENGYTFPVYFDVGQQGAAAYGVTAIPTTYFISSEGTVVKRQIGGIDAATLEYAIGLLE